MFVLLIPSAGAQETPSTRAPRRQPKVEGPVYVDPLQTDSDFALQGEYRGWQRPSRSSEIRQAGLQVVALGRQQFGAANYLGGLPGDGWFGGERRLFAGQRTGGTVELLGNSQRLLVGLGYASLFDLGGQLMGEFRRVERTSPTLGALPPPGAVILFREGQPTDGFTQATITAEGYLQAGTETIGRYTDFRLHAEFRLPYKPEARGQARGNSGFYLQSRYEVQVLDSFGLEGVENECGALYKTRRPDFNMCFPPLVWQTYDIDLTSPRFDEAGNKLSNMRISVWHNGVMIHNDAEIPSKTGAGQPETPLPLPTKLQDHDNPVVYRNIWLIEKPAPSQAPPSSELALSRSGRHGV